MTPLRIDPGDMTHRRQARPARRWPLAGSVLLHAAILALLLLTARPRERLIEPEPSYELVFNDGGAPDRSTSEQSAPEQLPAVPVPDAPPESTPLPSSIEPPPPEQAPPELPAPVPAPTPLEPPTLLPQQPEPVQTQPPSPPPQAAEPSPEPTPAPSTEPERPRDPPTVRLTEPAPLPPSLNPQSLAPDLALNIPPVPPAAPPPQQAQRRPTPDPLRFPAPVDLNYGSAASRTPAAPRGTVASRAIDLSLNAAKLVPNKSEAFFDARAAKLSADWASGLVAYWRRHRYYPRQAAENGEDGTVKVDLVVNRFGKVESVEVRGRSGSPWLDMAALSTWRGAQLAPFPAENTEPRITMTLTINYILMR